jgi:1-phosphatidylinositol-4-phosphate 5-kinase
MKHGEGTFVWPEIGTYEGSFYANFIQGRGVLKLVNSTYEGWFYKNKKHGKGKLCYSNGDTYEGEFSNDMK